MDSVVLPGNATLQIQKTPTFSNVHRHKCLATLPATINGVNCLLVSKVSRVCQLFRRSNDAVVWNGPTTLPQCIYQHLRGQRWVILSVRHQQCANADSRASFLTFYIVAKCIVCGFICHRHYELSFGNWFEMHIRCQVISIYLFIYFNFTNR